MEPASPSSMVRLLRDLDPVECARRNALAKKKVGMMLRCGHVGVVLEKLEAGRALLVEFDFDGACGWLGVLYDTEVELVPAALPAAA